MKTQTLERQRTETPKPSLEQLVQQTSYYERDNALKQLQAAIAKILHPRGGYHVYSGSSNRHFLEVPQAPKRALTRAGWPDDKSVDEKEAEEFQRQLAEITLREKALDAAAQKARSQIEALVKWGGRIGENEDMLLLAGSVLDESDRPAVMAYIAEHQRFCRTCRHWTDRLQF